MGLLSLIWDPDTCEGQQLIAVADPGERRWRAPPTGPDSFVLTYKFFET